MKYYSKEELEAVYDLLKIGISLTSEMDDNRLFERILTEARRVTHADAGTLYLCDENKLYFKIMQNDTLQVYKGGGGEVIDLPPVPMSEFNVAAYAAIHGESVNIPDVHNSDRFDFTGPKKYDQLTGYFTKSMLVVPMKKRDGEVIGVLQLINALDEQKQIIPFPKHVELVVESLASQAGVTLSNIYYVKEIDLLFNSFVQVMTAAIDSRSPYNVNHTKSVVRFSEGLAKYCNELYHQGRFHEYIDEQRLEQLVIAAWLHDIGKIAIPSRVMDKPTRLGRLFDKVKDRFDFIRALKMIEHMKQGIDSETQKQEMRELDEIWQLIVYCDNPSNFVDQERQQRLRAIAEMKYEDLQGEQHPYLTAEEIECLAIPRGTLTKREREIMESHVVHTKIMLDKMHFSKKLQNVPIWAALHHELLDGSGYPNRLVADQIPLEVRIMTIADIYDALTARDRPYKKPMPPEKALDILSKMAEEGKLDRQLVDIFIESNVWKQLDPLT